jgi:hypothetical protein
MIFRQPVLLKNLLLLQPLPWLVLKPASDPWCTKTPLKGMARRPQEGVWLKLLLQLLEVSIFLPSLGLGLNLNKN